MKDEKKALSSKVEKLEKTEILNALKNSDWVKSAAAKALGITERMVGYKIKKYGLEKEVHEQKTTLKASKYKKMQP